MSHKKTMLRPSLASIPLLVLILLSEQARSVVHDTLYITSGYLQAQNDSFPVLTFERNPAFHQGDPFLEVTTGDTLELRLTNADAVDHTVGIMHTALTPVLVPSGGSVVLQISGLSDGVYQLYDTDEDFQYQGLSTIMSVVVTPADTTLLRLANIGFTITKYTFPAQLNARIVASDGRALPTEELSDTLRLYPGERYSVLVTAPSGFEGHIVADYLSMHNDLWLGQNSLPVNTDEVLGSPHSTDVSEAMVVPNPFTTHFTVRSEAFCSSDRVEVCIRSASGREIKRLVVMDFCEEITVSGDEFASGVYFVEIRSDRHHEVLKVIKK